MASFGIVNISDFTGTIFIQKGCHDQLQFYIDTFESKYLYELLGIEKADLLVADLVGGVPVDPDILAWFNPFFIEEKSCHYIAKTKVLTSEGVVKMLSYLIYFEFVKGEEYTVMDSGLVRSESENSQEKKSVATQFFIQTKAWNRAVDTWRAIKEKECLLTDFQKMFL